MIFIVLCYSDPITDIDLINTTGWWHVNHCPRTGLRTWGKSRKPTIRTASIRDISKSRVSQKEAGVPTNGLRCTVTTGTLTPTYKTTHRKSHPCWRNTQTKNSFKFPFKLFIATVHDIDRSPASGLTQRHATTQAVSRGLELPKPVRFRYRAVHEVGQSGNVTSISPRTFVFPCQ